MVLKNQKWYKILFFLLENPTKEFTIREISKFTKIPASSVQRILKSLKTYSLINEKNRFLNSEYTRFLKTFLMIEKLYNSGLIEYLNSNYKPTVIMLFGSIRKGEYDSTSDIDMFIESENTKKVELLSYEKQLRHKIQLFIEKDIKNLPKNLFNNIANGIKLSGYLKVK